MSEKSPQAQRLRPPRWLPLRATVGGALVIGSVVVGARVTAAAQRTEPVWAVVHPLNAGDRVTAADLVVRQVRLKGSAAAYVAAGALPADVVATRRIDAGELLAVGAVATGGPDVTRLVTVAVAAGHLPPDVGRDSRVDVYVTTKAGVTSPVLADVAVAQRTAPAGDFGGQTAVAVVLRVPADRVDAVLQAFGTGTVDLVGRP